MTVNLYNPQKCFDVVHEFKMHYLKSVFVVLIINYHEKFLRTVQHLVSKCDFTMEYHNHYQLYFQNTAVCTLGLHRHSVHKTH